MTQNLGGICQQLLNGFYVWLMLVKILFAPRVKGENIFLLQKALGYVFFFVHSSCCCCWAAEAVSPAPYLSLCIGALVTWWDTAVEELIGRSTSQSFWSRKVVTLRDFDVYPHDAKRNNWATNVSPRNANLITLHLLCGNTNHAVSCHSRHFNRWLF